jgi:superfamily II RNA helicase
MESVYDIKESAVLKELYSAYNFELSEFQQSACEAIVTGHHALICAPTGSGKTLPAEVAIRHLCQHNMKVIYTTPIKALSNQKYHDLTRLFPDLNIGILTGDIKFNPEADVIIMTTEILRNTLFKKKLKTEGTEGTPIENLLHFNIDFDTELAAVIFDEVHYINDPDRGHIWEESIMLLPQHVQMVMLSATLDDPSRFANWINSVRKQSLKQVHLCETQKRAVPLTHYGYVTHRPKAVEKMKNKKTVLLMETHANTFLDLSKEPNFHRIAAMKSILNNHEATSVRRKFVMNSLLKDLSQKDMLPAICFIFSRKQIEIAAGEVEGTYIDDDDAIKVVTEFNYYLRKFANYKEYMQLDQYHKIISFLKKGIAIHHSGVLPLFREIVEILFGKHYINVLFATETFAVGINMPTKTVIFNSISKFDGKHNRFLKTFEYTQMAGRAGRRGFDKIGNVIHCNNLFDLPTRSEYSHMLSGAAPTISSKFCIGFNTILNLIGGGVNTYETIHEYISSSMLTEELVKERTTAKKQIDAMTAKIEYLQEDFASKTTTPTHMIERVYEIDDKLHADVNSFVKLEKKQVKKLRAEVRNIKGDPKCQSLEQDVILYATLEHSKNLLLQEKAHYDFLDTYIERQINCVVQILVDKKFISNESESEVCHDALGTVTHTYNMSEMGTIAAHTKEMHSLAFAHIMLETNLFNDLNSEELIGFFSCFTNLRVAEDFKEFQPHSSSYALTTVLKQTVKQYEYYLDLEETYCMTTGEHSEFHYDFINELMLWSQCTTDEEALEIITKIIRVKGIYLGDFVKAIMKVSAIAEEVTCICELMGGNGNKLKGKLLEIPVMITKFIVTAQSLYLMVA